PENAAPAAAAPEASSEGPVSAADMTAPADPVVEEAGIEVIKSPSWGLFYAQPEPEAPPYVKVGDPVKAGDTVGLLEIMKTYTALVAEHDGEVVAIHVKNEQQLEPEQPVMSIKIK
ncbi:MAG TPA: acetyl-CoA carboxylase, biotin carboxyl carrier protein, partial [Firmicutes bacterium]|nr:acetyl-CoA carboxylase, biotin carboxyl carrier protein [Bacillota bacterium]